MKYYFFKQKRDRTDDPRIFGRTLRDFKVQALTPEAAINKYSHATLTTRPGRLTDESIPIRLTPDDITELYNITEYNFAIHREVVKLAIIGLVFLSLLGCDIKLGHPENPVGPSTVDGNVVGNVISYDDIKKNYIDLKGPAFNTYLNNVGVVKWVGTVSKLIPNENKVEIYIVTESNLLRLTTPSKNSTAMKEATKLLHEKVEFRANITGYDPNPKFVLLGDLEHIEAE